MASGGINSNGWTNRYRYDGRDGARYDTTTGLYWLSVRAYDPSLGRFLSRDPLGRAPLFFADNPYVYAGNNPLSNVDPSGQRYTRGVGGGRNTKTHSTSPTRTETRSGSPKLGSSSTLPSVVVTMLQTCGACAMIWHALLQHGKDILGWVGVGLIIIGIFLDIKALSDVLKSAETADILTVHRTK